MVNRHYFKGVLGSCCCLSDIFFLLLLSHFHHPFSPSSHTGSDVQRKYVRKKSLEGSFGCGTLTCRSLHGAQRGETALPFAALRCQGYQWCTEHCSQPRGSCVGSLEWETFCIRSSQRKGGGSPMQVGGWCGCWCRRSCCPPGSGAPQWDGAGALLSQPCLPCLEKAERHWHFTHRLSWWEVPGLEPELHLLCSFPGSSRESLICKYFSIYVNIFSNIFCRSVVILTCPSELVSEAAPTKAILWF